MNKSYEAKVVNLVADIGGTNIRLAITENNNITEIVSYQCANFGSLLDVIRQYLEEKKLTKAIINACLAIACPTDDDLISMTNLPWEFSQKKLKQALSLNKLVLINDYTAIAMAIPMLTDKQKVKIGGGQPIKNKPVAVFGPGTGLGVAILAPVNEQWHCLSGEGGHTDFTPIDELDIKLLEFMKLTKERVSHEQFLSGFGLEQIYHALVAINENDATATLPKKLSAKEISTKAIEKSCPFCQQALTQFCKILGSFGGDLSLTAGSLGGVYIAGGIVPRFIDYVRNSEFRARFESKGRLSHLNKQTPTYIITEEQPGLIGAAAYLHQIS